MELVMKRTVTFLIAGTMLTALAACGNSTGERAISGAAIGAAAGGVGGALVGDAATGAVVGGLAGAATGALTDRDQIDLGEFPF